MLLKELCYILPIHDYLSVKHSSLLKNWASQPLPISHANLTSIALPTLLPKSQATSLETLALLHSAINPLITTKYDTFSMIIKDSFAYNHRFTHLFYSLCLLYCYSKVCNSWLVNIIILPHQWPAKCMPFFSHPPNPSFNIFSVISP